MSASPESLHVVALVSGGKDSLFSLLHCLAYGHNVVALANLYPASQTSDPPHAAQGGSSTAEWDNDVDSFMYQTAGHSLIPLCAEALRLPLYRQQITGEARDTSLSYGGHGEDETEALVPLLNRVTDAHPEVNAVSSGAILSTYQRTRVESVALRLGLVPLAFLWQYPSLPPLSPGGLLDDMGRAGFDVRIIKVASGGLTKRFLWCDLTTSITRENLERALSPFGGSVLGEGGEYETMVVNAPSSLKVMQAQRFDGKPARHIDRIRKDISQFWEGRIEIAPENRLIVEGPGSESATLSFKHGSGNLSTAEVPNSSPDTLKASLRLPIVWDRHFMELARRTRGKSLFELADTRERIVIPKVSSMDSSKVERDRYEAVIQKLQVKYQPQQQEMVQLERQKKEAEDRVEALKAEQAENDSIREFVGPGPTTPDLPGTDSDPKTSHLRHLSRVSNLLVIANLTGLYRGDTVEEQMGGIKQQLLYKLQHMKRLTSSIVFTTILLRSMSDFATANYIYGELFEEPNPPARVTVACPLPNGIKLMMSITINMGEKSDALHVQSRSHWAPANIGPYSQAIRVPFTDSDAKGPSLVFVAGQIPLVPATMRLLSPCESHYEDFLQRSCLSLQHLWRVGREMKVSWWTGAVAFIKEGADQSSEAALAWTVWRQAHVRETWRDTVASQEDENDTQIDDLTTKLGTAWRLNASEEHDLPDFSRLNNTPVYHEFGKLELSEVPGIFIVEVDELPRGSDIEWQSLGVTQGDISSILSTISDEKEDIEVRSCITGSMCVSFIDLHSSGPRSISRAIDWLRNVSDPSSDILLTIYSPDFNFAANLKAQVVPCHRVWSSGGRRLSAGIVAQFDIGDGMSSLPVQGLARGQTA